MPAVHAAGPDLVDDALRALLEHGAARADALGSRYRGLWADLAAATAGGQRRRPALLLGAYRAYGGTDDRLAARVAAAVELLHTAFVVHDDVIDGDLVRRGRPNVGGAAVRRARTTGADEHGARAYADASGILAGDLALTAALRALALCGAPHDAMLRLHDLVDTAVHASAAGELADVGQSVGVSASASAGPDASLDEVLRTAELKTAAYSFALPLQAGAVLAGAPDDVVDRLAEVGRLCGVAFQLQDDVVGTFGDEARSGKSRLSDLREGRWTALVAHARTTAAWPSVAPFHGSPRLTREQADRVCALLEECGSRRVVERLAEDRLAAALALADEVGLPRELLAWVGARTAGLLRGAA
ncbi:polyprenyl synthetase family protein [Isoptericola sp. 4D.3]|uniref:Polyprenyl synthetase family protein n=1 Tax=Isoptericola peretonis TaxID=2918523 RepID=A0ABT0J4L7_9MICO|nr:polyprenyl synthetase family protein [Isoptericola sp. 4D.3]